VLLVVSAPVDCEPLAGLLPDQAPEAVHVVAFVDDHVSVEALPLATVLGLAVKLTVGAAPMTETVADCVALPPVPVQVSSKTVVLERGLVDHVPLVATGPCQPPDAVQAVASCEFQLKVDMPPLAIVAGDADTVTIGAGEVATTSAD
jgi:hypothetical protein